MVRRLINCTKSEILSMNAKQMKQSIKASEGRIILAQNYVGFGQFVQDTTNIEMSFVSGADMVFLNGYPMDGSDIPAFLTPMFEDGELDMKQLALKDIKEFTPGPIGVYLECGLGDDLATSTVAGIQLIREERVAS